jgi:CBS-domain-containing membrane protein
MLANAAQASVRRLVLESALSGVRLADIMTAPVVAADAGWTVHRLVYEIFAARRLTEVPVVHEGRPVGIVGVEDAQKLEQQYWPVMSVSQIMRELSVERLAHPQEVAASALMRVAGASGSRLYVLGPGGTLAGVVGQHDLLQAVHIGMAAAAGPTRAPEAASYYYPVLPAPPPLPPAEAPADDAPRPLPDVPAEPDAPPTDAPHSAHPE